jgi:hypothetical protein
MKMMTSMMNDAAKALGRTPSSLTDRERVELMQVVASIILAGAHDSNLVQKAMSIVEDR